MHRLASKGGGGRLGGDLWDGRGIIGQRSAGKNARSDAVSIADGSFTMNDRGVVGGSIAMQDRWANEPLTVDGSGLGCSFDQLDDLADAR